MYYSKLSFSKVLIIATLLVIALSLQANAQLQVTLSDAWGADFVIVDGGPEDMDAVVNDTIDLQYSVANSGLWSVSGLITKHHKWWDSIVPEWNSSLAYGELLIKNCVIEHYGGTQAAIGSIKIESDIFFAPYWEYVTLVAQLEGDYIKTDIGPLPPENPPIPLHSADISMSGWANGTIFSTLNPDCQGADCLNPTAAGADFSFDLPIDYVPGTEAYGSAGINISFILGPPDNSVNPPVPQDGIRIDSAVVRVCPCRGAHGNVNSDPSDKSNIADVSYLVHYLFGTPSGPAPRCRAEANANADWMGKVNISDVSYLISWLFGVPSGPAPPDCP